MHHTYSAEQVHQVIHATSKLLNTSELIQWLLIDSRKIVEPHNSLFFALPGKQNAHQYIPELFEKGVRNFVISDKKIAAEYADKANVYLVENTLVALQTLAAYHRKHFQYPVIGITGSNGKTIVKDWLYQLMSPEYVMVRSPKSYNSQIGVPLSVWNMNHAFQLGIF
jgi:Alr-MurF fusion protein